MKRWIKHVHFVGIGGIGMSGIAEVLLNLGFAVSGSDLKETAITARLRGLGARVAIGHSPANIKEADVVVISSAVKPENPEVVAARDQGIPVIPRAEMLAELMRMKHGIAVAGSHGKTTTTAMIATILAKAGFDPTAVIGGRLKLFDSNAKLGQSEWMVAEADESDGSFLHLSPTVVVVTNIDREHLDHYGTMEELKQAFVDFMNSVPFYGLVVAGADDPVVREIAPKVKRRTITYGLGEEADLRAEQVASEGFSCRFTAFRAGRRLGEVKLGVPGAFNALNALAALAVAFELGVEFEPAAQALSEFSGVGRRFELKGEEKGVMVIDDYAHHPTEIRALLEAARRFLKSSGRRDSARLVVAFQPHRFSRTRDLFHEFTESFFEPDILVMTEIYPAGENPLPGFSGERLFRAVGQRRAELGLPTHYVESVEEMPHKLKELVREGDVVITLGAGSVYRAGEALLKMLEE